jgi:mRNA interferase MazF
MEASFTSRLAGPPARGDIWLVDLKPVVGHEQGGRRPAVVISANGLNRSAAGLVIVLPMTTVHKGMPSHVMASPSDSDVREVSYIKCEDIRSISTRRLVTHWGRVSAQTMAQVSDTVRILLQL